MTTHIKVYPAKASALNAHHPTAGAPRSEGTDWPHDVFTCRRLSDGSFTEDPAKAYRPPPVTDAAAEKSVQGSSTITAGTDLGKSSTPPAFGAAGRTEQDSTDSKSK